MGFADQYQDAADTDSGKGKTSFADQYQSIKKPARREETLTARTPEEKRDVWREKAADILHPWLDAALMGGSGLVGGAVGGPAGAIAGTAWGHLAAKDVKDRIKGERNVQADRIMEGKPRKASTKEELIDDAKTFGTGLAYGIVPEAMGYGGKAIGNFGKKAFPEFMTPATPESMAGNALLRAGYNDPKYISEQAKATQLQEDVPGTYFTPGEATNNPEMLRLQQATRLKAGPTQEIENVTRNKEASRNLLGQAIPDVADASTAQGAIAKQQARLQGDIARTSQERSEQAGQFNPAERKDTGKAIEGILAPANETSWQGVKKAYSALGNEQTSVPGLSGQLENLSKSINPAEEDIFPKSEVARIQEMLSGGEESKILGPNGKPIPKSSPDRLPFQELVDIDQMLTRSIKRAPRKSPLERNLLQVQATIRNGMMKQAESQGNGDIYKAALGTAKKHYDVYVAGSVEEALRPGNILRDASGKKMAKGYEDLGKHFWGERQADELIRAVGKEKAAPIMENHAVNELVENNVINPTTGEVNTKALAKWNEKNKVTLSKFGLRDKFFNAKKSGETFDAAQTRFNEFGLSAAGKFLGAEPRQALATAFASNPSNPSQVMKDLLAGVGDDKIARHGLKVAFKDLMVKEIEDAHGEAIKSISSGIDAPRTLAQRLDKYGLAAEELFKDDPSQLAAMHKVREVMETTLRSQRNLGVGSNTADKFAAVEGAIQGESQRVAKTVLTKGLLRKIPGLNWYLDSVRATAKEKVAANAEQTFKVIVQAMYDPPLAKLLTQNAATPSAQKAVARQIGMRMQPGISGVMGWEGDYIGQILSNSPSDEKRVQTLRGMKEDDRENTDYDMERYKKDGNPYPLPPGKHYPDKYKKENHITKGDWRYLDKDGKPMPDEKSDGTPNTGGTWHFYVSDTNLKYHTPEEYKKYFSEREKNSVLHLPDEKPKRRKFGTDED